MLQTGVFRAMIIVAVPTAVEAAMNGGRDTFLPQLADRAPTQFVGTLLALVAFDIWAKISQELNWIRRENKGKLQISMSSTNEIGLLINKIGEGSMASLIGDSRIAKIIEGLLDKTTDEDPLIRIPSQDREVVERALTTVIKKILEDPRQILDIHLGTSELVIIELWVAATFERYGLRRNLIPRLIVVPAAQLSGEVPSSVGNVEKGSHRALRLKTHQAMRNDIARSDGPEACFKVSINRAKRK